MTELSCVHTERYGKIKIGNLYALKIHGIGMNKNSNTTYIVYIVIV